MRIVSLFLLLCLFVNAEANVRTWTDRSGDHKIKARLLDFDQQTVILVSGNKRKRVKRSRFSIADQKYISSLAEKRVKSEHLLKTSLALSSSQAEISYQQLREAGKLDTLRIRADFEAGLVAVKLNSFKDAAVSFETCIDRWKWQSSFFSRWQKQTYVAALNNRAILHLRERKAALAISKWREALKFGLETPTEIIQNVGSAIAFGNSNMRFINRSDIPLKKPHERSLSELLTLANLGENSHAYTPGIGWLYMNYPEEKRNPEKKIITDKTTPKVKPTPPPPPSDLSQVASGTGFLVSPTLLITNQHVVRNQVTPAMQKITPRFCRVSQGCARAVA